MKTPQCAITIMNSLLETISDFGRNKADHPFGIGYHDKQWWVYVEIDCSSATFDIETHHDTLENALARALAKVRRELTITTRVAT